MDSPERNVEKYTAVLVAQYLKKKGYLNTLKDFQREASVPVSVTDDLDNGTASSKLDDLQSIVSDRVGFDDYMLKDRLKDLTLNDALPPIDTERFRISSWNFDVKFNNVASKSLNFIPISMAFCHDSPQSLLISTAGRELAVFDEQLDKQKTVVDENGKSLGVVKLAGAIPGSNMLYACTMDGSLHLFNEKYESLQNWKHKLHARMITQIQFSKKSHHEWYVVTSGMDNTLKVSILDNSTLCPTLTERSVTNLLSACTTMNMASCEVTVGSSKITKQLVILSRMDFTHLVCYLIDENSKLQNIFNIALNNAQFSTHSFNVRDVEIINAQDYSNTPIFSHNTFLAVATSHVPYMRLVLVELPDITEAIESYYNSEGTPDTSSMQTHTYYDKIMRNIATQIPQDSYSQPVMKYIPKCGGLVVGGDASVYAIDLHNGESWELEVAGYTPGERVKSLDVDRVSSMISVGTASKNVLVAKL